MLITPPDLAWGCSFRGLWACWFLDAWQHRLRRCLLMCGFTVVGLPYCLAMVRTGLLVPVCGRSWPSLGAWPATALRQLYNFFTQGRLDLGHLRSAGVAGRSRRCLHLDEPGLLCVPARRCPPMVSDASGWAGPPWSAGATRVNHTDHDGGQRGRQWPARVCLTVSSAPRAPPARRRRRLSGHPGRDLRPVRTPQPLPCATGDEPSGCVVS